MAGVPISTTTRPGTHAVLRGLQSKPELNGLAVVLVSFNSETGRWQCRTVQGDECVNVKPANLEAEPTKDVSQGAAKKAKNGRLAPSEPRKETTGRKKISEVSEATQENTSNPAATARDGSAGLPSSPRGKARIVKEQRKATAGKENAEIVQSQRPATAPAGKRTYKFGPRTPSGTRALLKGLLAKPELNGITVEIMSWNAETGRFQCKCVEDEKIVNIKPPNLIGERARASSEKPAPTSHEGAAEDADVPQQKRRKRAASANDAKGAAATAATAAEVGCSPVRRKSLMQLIADGKGVSPAPAPGVSPARPSMLGGEKKRLQRRLSELHPEEANAEGGEAKRPKAAAKASRRCRKDFHAPPGERTVEQTYQKCTPLEHILLRPDSYVGSTEKQQQEHWVLGSTEEGERRMERKKLDYVPSLYKIYDEILVNAADNLVRDVTMDTIRVDIDVLNATISVWNNGRGLPVEIHKEHNCYVPDMVFGQLLTSDNYDDSEKKVVGGRNGYGAKLTNIFSTRFVVETADSKSGQWYRQVWEQNMTVRHEPEIQPFKGEDYTKVTFTPELSRFGMETLEEDIVSLMRRRAYDTAASTRGRCKVHLDGELLEVSSFSDYVGLYLPPDAFRVCEACTDRWEVALALTDGSGFNQVSFVNSINTSRGGTHVTYIADQVVTSIMDKLANQKEEKDEQGKKTGKLHVKPQVVKNYLWVFVNCLIENPGFDSQTKETLTSKRDRFGSTCTLSEETLGAVLTSGVLEMVTEWSKALGKSDLARHLNRSDYGMQKRLYGIPKLEDANKAGTDESGECTLILTEGDSAKALAVAGLGIVGRDRYGVFPLRGKLRNVRDLTMKQIQENKEIESLMKILAMDASKEYTSTKGLRYGSIMIMTDQDFDGSHIKGLIINFLQHWFPTLLKVPGFLKEFVTPIVKVTKGDESKMFFTVQEYEEWKEDNDNGKGWKCKYYKGLGTSTSGEAREYFSDLPSHQLLFLHSGGNDDDLVDMAFNQKRADDRKEWILGCNDEEIIDHTEESLTYSDFINKELVHFAKYDVERMLPSMVDGLKPGQRKVLFGAFKKKLVNDTKVAQFSGYVAEHSMYHHGETSLQATIINMAQTHVGSNNINLFVPSGQFGTRLQGGKDHAASRYIFTRLAPVARCCFPEEDDGVLEYKSEEGMSIEPKWYAPIIPLVLCNGAEGIGVGWATSIPNFNPRDIIANLRRHFKGEELVPMNPWYRGYKGTIVPMQDEKPGRFAATGVAVKRGRTRLEITELPVRKWTQDYKEFLLEQIPKAGEERKSMITEFREYHTENSVHFSVTLTPDKLALAESRGIEKMFHLRTSLSTNNMMLFDSEGVLKKYATAEQVIQEFAPVRLEVYRLRKEHHVQRIMREVAVLSDKAKFIRLVVRDELIVEKRPAADVCADMRRQGLRTMRQIKEGVGEQKASKKDPDPDRGADNTPDGYGYLFRMKLWTLTEERLAVLDQQVRDRNHDLEALRATTLEQLWETDLVKLEKALDAADAEDAKELAEAERLARKANPKGEESLVNKQCVLVLSPDLRIKRVHTDEWKASKKGGKMSGHRGLAARAKVKKLKSKVGAEVGAEGGEDAGKEEEDKNEPPAEEEDEDGEAAADNAEGEQEEAEAEAAVKEIFACQEFDALLAFTEHGFVHALQALDVPLARTSAEGRPIHELIPELAEGKQITSLMTVPQGALKGNTEEYAVLITVKGSAKKVPLHHFRTISSHKASCAIKLDEGDSLRWVRRASCHDHLILASERGMLLRFPLAAKGLAPTSLKSRGRPVMKMNHGDRVASCDIANCDGSAGPARKIETQKKKVLAITLFRKDYAANGGSFIQANKYWLPLTPEQKKVYEDRAAAMNEELKLAGSDVAMADVATAEGAADPHSRSKSAFMCYLQETGKSISAGSVAWKQLTPDERRPYEEMAAKAKPKQSCDDDDSDNPSPPHDPASPPRADASMDVDKEHGDADEEEEDDEGDEGDDADEADGAADEEAGASDDEEEACEGESPTGFGQTALLVTKLGMCKRCDLVDIVANKPNRKGKKGIRLSCASGMEDEVISFCVLPVDKLGPLPKKVKSLEQLFYEKLEDSGETAPSYEEKLARFQAISEEKRTALEQQREALMAKRQTAVTARKEQEKLTPSPQILLCTQSGFVRRVDSTTIEVRQLKRGPQRVLKVSPADTLCSTSVLSSIDAEVLDEEFKALEVSAKDIEIKEE